MSHFLRNLIDRHQEGGVGREVSRKVQPRPKAKFETDSGSRSFTQNDLGNNHDFTQVTDSDPNTGSSSTHYDPDTKPTTASASKQSSQQTQIPAELPKFADQPDNHNLSITDELSVDKPLIQSDSNQRIDDLKQRIDAVTLQLGRKSPVLETPISATENPQQTEDPSELSEITAQSKSRDLSLPSELNQSIQTILNSLNSQQPQRTDDPTKVESQREPALSDIGNNIPTEPVQLPLTPETTSDFAQPAVKVKKQSMDSRLEQRESHQAGLLQTPNWLTEMQADLNNRWREINTKAEPEPVVNVTIGRVEVRAVQPEAVQQTKPKQKPSGVMSLDDYLKQRENRGRA